ncbi:MAG: GTPase ObgE [Actinobacteria bacterium]|nr:GTPase ObgE [Actinomycetota bacterium]MDQ3532957.1 GTPase ObgE [Actinomycetota bacterium]
MSKGQGGFVDEARIFVSAGAGGSGSAAFHHEPYKPKGGPDGGDGADGGSVILRADPSVGTLLELRDHPHVKAGPGGAGRSKRRHGAHGKDRVVLVPPGTIVHDEHEVLIADLANPGDQVVAAAGGRGGRGNVSFTTSTRRAPGWAEKGEPGEERRLRLELRLLADVGLVGFPNAGKSTLISRISAARPKVAPYPFTTLAPNLGVVRAGEGTFVVADIPGLVPGAHTGKGLGDRFLRHVRRAAVLVFLIDLAAEDRDPLDDVDVLKTELAAFDPALTERPSLVVATKLDVGGDRIAQVERRLPDALVISAVTGSGIDGLIERLAREVTEARAETPAAVGYVRHVVREEPIAVTREDGGWRVTGRRAERAVQTTDMARDEAVVILQRRLISMGVERALEAAGAVRGDEVRIAGQVFGFEPEGSQEDVEVPGREPGES